MLHNIVARVACVDVGSVFTLARSLFHRSRIQLFFYFLVQGHRSLPSPNIEPRLRRFSIFCTLFCAHCSKVRPCFPATSAQHVSISRANYVQLEIANSQRLRADLPFFCEGYSVAPSSKGQGADNRVAPGRSKREASEPVPTLPVGAVPNDPTCHVFSAALATSGATVSLQSFHAANAIPCESGRAHLCFPFASPY